MTFALPGELAAIVQEEVRRCAIRLVAVGETAISDVNRAPAGLGMKPSSTCETHWGISSFQCHRFAGARHHYSSNQIRRNYDSCHVLSRPRIHSRWGQNTCSPSIL
jgi:hypothetical protein